LGATVTNQNLNQEEIKRRLNSGNACYHSVQNLLPSRLLPKNVNIITYKTTILPAVLYGCESCYLILREEVQKRLNSGNACYHSVKNLVSSRLHCKTVKVRICKITILSAVLYGCKTWSLILREQHKTEGV
jgi:hypothetical protein